jgi:exopolysaccharide production protein ExoY
MEVPGSSTTPIESFSAGRQPFVGSDTSATISARAQIEAPFLVSPIGRALKRSMDLVGSAVALLLLAPLLIVLAAALAVESRGHPIFVQRRIGQFGRPFRIYKFRTMSRSSESDLATALANTDLAAEWAALRKLRDDPRVTRIGRILRKYSLDELPQFVNVLLGHMSLVGPRPVVEDELPLFGGLLQTVLTMRPGLTGLWGTSGRNAVSYAERVELEHRYVMSWTLGLDASIMVKTIPRVLKGSGAY